LTTSDSLSGTTSCIEERSLSTAKELEELEPDPEEPDPEAPVAAEEAPNADAAEDDEPEPDDPDPEELEEPLVVPLAVTASPTSPERASSALCTVRRSLLTAARAEAMLASRAAVLSVALAAEEPESDSRLVEELPVPAAPDSEEVSREGALPCSVWVVVLGATCEGAVVVSGVVLAGAVVAGGEVVCVGAVTVVGGVDVGAVVVGLVGGL
jgi:hypothetical protein